MLQARFERFGIVASNPEVLGAACGRTRPVSGGAMDLAYVTLDAIMPPPGLCRVLSRHGGFR